MSDADDEIEAIRERKREELIEDATAPESPDASESSGTPGSPDEPVHVDGQAHLQELVGEHDVVLVDFYADWCGPCKMLEPVVAEIAAETDAAVTKVDIDAHQGLAQQYQVQGVPTLYLFAGGEPAQRWVGVQDKGTLVGAIESAA